MKAKHPDPDGTGRVGDGTLCPVTLSVLADALVDAGVPEEEACGACGGSGLCGTGYGSAGVRTCDDCNGTGRLPHPLLAALREPVARYRGFWVVDLLTGRS